MKVRSDFERKQVKKAQAEFEMAESKLDSALQYTREGDDENYAANFVDAQRCIERSTKSIFKLLDVNHPNDHSINPASQDGRNLLNAVKSEVDGIEYPIEEKGFLSTQEITESHVDAVSRLMFLCNMYGEMYTLASYGIDMPDIEVSQDRIIANAEYEFITESAVSALRIADVIIDSISTGELRQSNRPEGLEGPMEQRSQIKGTMYGVGKTFTKYDPIADYRRNL